MAAVRRSAHVKHPTAHDTLPPTAAREPVAAAPAVRRPPTRAKKPATRGALAASESVTAVLAFPGPRALMSAQVASELADVASARCGGKKIRSCESFQM
jgi:hypothetical protein